MNMQLAVTLLPYIGLAISLIVTLGLFSGLSHTIEKLRGRIGKFEAQMQAAKDFSEGISALKRRVQELETGTPAVENAGGRPPSLNGTVRSKVLKMHRLGQPVDRIADNLRVPKGEVDLLVKVHQIVMRPYEQVTAGPEDSSAS